MGYTIEARPTRWRGIDFKSQLEALWYETFLMAGLAPVYEPITIKTPNGPHRTYTPDFSLMGMLLVEIKPSGYDDESNRARLLAVPAPVLLISGRPHDQFRMFVTRKGWESVCGTLEKLIDTVAGVAAYRVMRMHRIGLT